MGREGHACSTPRGVAASVIHALAQPEHVAVNEILVEPRDEPV